MPECLHRWVEGVDEPVGHEGRRDAGDCEQGDREPQRQRPVRRLLDRRLVPARRAQVPPEPGGVDAEQADRADHRDRDLVLTRPVADAVGQPEQDDDEDRQQEQRRGVVGKARVEAHDAVACNACPGHDRQAEHQQRVREQRAEDRRLGDDDLAGREREQHDEELGQIAECRLEHARDGGAEVRADRLRADPDRPREPAERGGGHDEDGDGIRVGVVEQACDRRQREDRAEQQPLSHRARGLAAPK